MQLYRFPSISIISGAPQVRVHIYGHRGSTFIIQFSTLESITYYFTYCIIHEFKQSAKIA